MRETLDTEATDDLIDPKLIYETHIQSEIDAIENGTGLYVIIDSFTKDNDYKIDSQFYSNHENVDEQLRVLLVSDAFVYKFNVQMKDNLGDSSFNIESMEIKEEDQSSSDFIVDFANQRLAWIVYGMLFIVLIIAICGTIQMYVQDVTIYVDGILLFGLYTWDFYSDFVFTSEVFTYSKDNDFELYSLILCILCVVFLITPIVASIVSLMKFQTKWTNDKSIGDRVKGWNRDWSSYLLFATIISGSSFAAVSLLNSRVFGHPLFCMGLSYRHLKKFGNQRLWSVILSENIPQITIQIFFVIHTNTFEIATMLAMASSFISVIVAVIDIYQNKKLFGRFSEDDYITIFKIPVIDPFVREHQNKLALSTHRFQGVFGTILELPAISIEVDLPTPSKNGLIINFSCRTVKKKPSGMYDAMIKAQRNGYMAKEITKAWKLDLKQSVTIGRITMAQVGKIQEKVYDEELKQSVNPLTKEISDGTRRKATPIKMFESCAQQEINENIEVIVPYDNFATDLLKQRYDKKQIERKRTATISTKETSDEYPLPYPESARTAPDPMAYGRGYGMPQSLPAALSVSLSSGANLEMTEIKNEMRKKKVNEQKNILMKNNRVHSVEDYVAHSYRANAAINALKNTETRNRNRSLSNNYHHGSRMQSMPNNVYQQQPLSYEPNMLLVSDSNVSHDLQLNNSMEQTVPMIILGGIPPASQHMRAQTSVSPQPFIEYGDGNEYYSNDNRVQQFHHQMDSQPHYTMSQQQIDSGGNIRKRSVDQYQQQFGGQQQQHGRHVTIQDNKHQQFQKMMQNNPNYTQSVKNFKNNNNNSRQAYQHSKSLHAHQQTWVAGHQQSPPVQSNTNHTRADTKQLHHWRKRVQVKTDADLHAQAKQNDNQRVAKSELRLNNDGSEYRPPVPTYEQQSGGIFVPPAPQQEPSRFVANEMHRDRQKKNIQLRAVKHDFERQRSKDMWDIREQITGNMDNRNFKSSSNLNAVSNEKRRRASDDETGSGGGYGKQQRNNRGQRYGHQVMFQQQQQQSQQNFNSMPQQSQQNFNSMQQQSQQNFNSMQQQNRF